MEQELAKKRMVRQLQNEVLAIQGLKKPTGVLPLKLGLGPLHQAFPDQTFPTSAIHEFISRSAETAAATTGFMAGLIGALMQRKGPCLWISTQRMLFPPALKPFGIAPDQIVFIDLVREKDLLWAMEEALKCEGLAAVVGEIRNISLTESRRLQLAVEKSHVTGFLHHCSPWKLTNSACVSRWQISPMASVPDNGLPGIGHPRWDVELLKIRNGQPGRWPMEWADGGFRYGRRPVEPAPGLYQKTG